MDNVTPKVFMNPILATSIHEYGDLEYILNMSFVWIWSFKRLSPLEIQHKYFLREVTNVKIIWTVYKN